MPGVAILIIASADLPCFKRLPFIENNFQLQFIWLLLFMIISLFAALYNAVKFAVISCADCKASGVIFPELKSKGAVVSLHNSYPKVTGYELPEK